MREYEESCVLQRSNLEAAELQNRDTIEVSERQDRFEEICYTFHQEAIALKVDRKFYADLITKIEDMSAAHQQLLLNLQDELSLVNAAKTKLEAELTDIRVEQKRQARELPERVRTIEENLSKALAEVIDSTEKQKYVENNTVLQNFNMKFGHDKQLYLDLLYDVKSKMMHYSHVLQESRSLHSNLPLRVRRRLEDCSKEELLFMMDAVSYDDSVSQYFEKKFPKEKSSRMPLSMMPLTSPYSGLGTSCDTPDNIVACTNLDSRCTSTP
jgi:hypothetical protein